MLGPGTVRGSGRLSRSRIWPLSSPDVRHRAGLCRPSPHRTFRTLPARRRRAPLPSLARGGAGMLDAARQEHRCACRGLDSLACHPDAQGTLDHVERLVLQVVEVRGGCAPRTSTISTSPHLPAVSSPATRTVTRTPRAADDERALRPSSSTAPPRPAPLAHAPGTSGSCLYSPEPGRPAQGYRRAAAARLVEAW